MLDAAAFGEFYVAKDYGIITNFNGSLAKYPTQDDGQLDVPPRGQPRLAGRSAAGVRRRGQRRIVGTDAEADQAAAFKVLREVMLDLSWVINTAYNQAVNAVADNVEGLGRHDRHDVDPGERPTDVIPGSNIALMPQRAEWAGPSLRSRKGRTGPSRCYSGVDSTRHSPNRVISIMTEHSSDEVATEHLVDHVRPAQSEDGRIRRQRRSPHAPSRSTRRARDVVLERLLHEPDLRARTGEHRHRALRPRDRRLGQRCPVRRCTTELGAPPGSGRLPGDDDRQAPLPRRR